MNCNPGKRIVGERKRKQSGHTVNEDGEPQEGKVSLPFNGVPADVWITFSQEHRAALEATACQVGDHLHIEHKHLNIL